MAYGNDVLMKTLSDVVLDRINPPLDMATFDDVERLLADPACITLCLRSTYEFVRRALSQRVARGIPGDIVLVGVWRGGLALYLQALLLELGQTDRRLYLSDTFKGFMPVSDDHPDDKRMLDYFATLRAPSGSRQEVALRMQDWDLPLDNVVFLEGDVRETTADFDRRIAMLLVDVDFYQPTRDALNNLHRHVAPGGCVYVDDYGVEEYGCRRAVDDFLAASGMQPALERVNRFAVSWRR